ncbi:MAG: F0F1 ATP synthase subunit alpha, partial [Microbacterium sp.]
RGARLTELLKQPQYDPYPVEEQVVAVWAGTRGKLDTLEVEDVLRFERDLIEHLRRHSTILDVIRDTNVLDDDTEAALEAEVDKVLLAFQAGKEHHIGDPGREEFAPADAEDVSQEQIVKGVRG